MLSLENIKAAYENSDLLISASRIDIPENEPGKNLAVDVEAYTRVLTLQDAKFQYSGDEFYLPGKSYLLSFRELANILLTKRAFTYRDAYFINSDAKIPPQVNLTPQIISNLLQGNPPLKNIDLNLNDRERKRRYEWLSGKCLEEIVHFTNICSARKLGRDFKNDGVVFLQNIDPITPYKNHIGNLTSTEINLSNITLPISLSANEAEFTFSSPQGSKISDGDERVGIFKKGTKIMTLRDISFQITGEKIETSINQTVRYEEKVIKYGLLSGAGIGFVGGISLCGIFDYLSPEHASLVNYLSSGIASTVAGMLFANKFNNRTMTIYDGTRSQLKFAFYGTVKKDEIT